MKKVSVVFFFLATTVLCYLLLPIWMAKPCDRQIKADSEQNRTDQKVHEREWSRSYQFVKQSTMVRADSIAILFVPFVPC